MRRIILTGVLGILLACCDRDAGEDTGYGTEAVQLSLESGLVADSTTIFVFRKRATSDTLIAREVVRGVTETMRTFTLDLPAGYYDFRVVANVGEHHVTMKAPYSPADLFIDYADGTEPPPIAFGMTRVNVGVDKRALSGLVVLTPFVQLTVRDVPEGVEHVDIDVLNTGAGYYMDRQFADEMARPCITSSLHGVQPDSTYVTRIYCFPTVKKYGESSLVVRCYDTNGKLVYRGNSAPFTIISRMLISCSFGKVVRSRSGADGSDIILNWEYDEEDF